MDVAAFSRVNSESTQVALLVRFPAATQASARLVEAFLAASCYPRQLEDWKSDY